MSDNESIWSYDFEKDKEIVPGRLLLSEPFMFDENFRRTVVLLCSHDDENGTVGVILNKPINLRLNDVVEEFPQFKGKLYLGGPVATDTLQFIHSLGDEIEGSVKLSDHVYWGGNFEQLRTLVTAGKLKPDDVKFYLGYSGWETGQLLQEMKDNSWIIAKGNYKHIFQSDVNTLWKNVMKEMGGVYDTMANYPENPTLN